RSLRMIFSVVSACSGARLASKSANDSPPALPRSLWQPTQYWRIVCVVASACGSGAADRRESGACAESASGNSPAAVAAISALFIVANADKSADYRGILKYKAIGFMAQGSRRWVRFRVLGAGFRVVQGSGCQNPEPP